MTLRTCSRILAGTLGAYGLTALATAAVFHARSTALLTLPAE